MGISNTPRWIILLAAIVITSVGLVVFVNAYQNINSGPYFTAIPSLGYENKFLSYSEIAIVGGIIAAIGILLGLVSIGARKWPKYEPKEFYISGNKAIGIWVASTDYEKDKGIIQNLMQSIEIMVHTRNEFSIGEPDSKMGWNFFILYIAPNLLQRIADYIVMDEMAQNLKPEDRFIEWLTEKLKEKECNVYFDLESKKGSSKYGLF